MCTNTPKIAHFRLVLFSFTFNEPKWWCSTTSDPEGILLGKPERNEEKQISIIITPIFAQNGAFLLQKSPQAYTNPRQPLKHDYWMAKLPQM
jgi:hypothetical protein